MFTKLPWITCCAFLCAWSGGHGAAADDEEQVAAELRTTAEAFVAAYNEKNPEAIAELYTVDAAMIDEIEGAEAEGRDAIREAYAMLFEESPERRLALEVGAVRVVSEDVAVEDGLIHFTTGEDGEELESVAYSATLVREEESDWRIAVSRKIRVVASEDGGPGEALEVLDWLPGEWTIFEDGMRLDVEIGWAPAGHFLVGEARASSSTGEDLVTTIRIGYDASSDAIRWWVFDDDGGFASGDWTRLGDFAWEIDTSGVTSSGERNASTKLLEFDGENTLSWLSTNRVLDGEALPDVEIILVRRPPPPGLETDEETPDNP